MPLIGQGSEFTRGGSIKDGAIISYGQGTQVLANTKVVSVAGTSHHFNVTIGENEQFMHTAQGGGGHPVVPRQAHLPAISSQSDASLRLKGQTLGNEYVGLMSQKTKHGPSVESVQSGYAVGTTLRQPLIVDQNMKMTRFDANMASSKFQTIGQAGGMLGETTQVNRPRLGSQSSIDYDAKQTMQISNAMHTINVTDDSQRLDATRRPANFNMDTDMGLQTVQKTQNNAFENFMGRVVTSVQHRKKHPRLKSLFGGQSSNRSQITGDYGSVAQPPALALEHDDTQLVPPKNLSVGGSRHKRNQTIDYLGRQDSSAAGGKLAIAGHSSQRTATTLTTEENL